MNLRDAADFLEIFELDRARIKILAARFRMESLARLLDDHPDPKATKKCPKCPRLFVTLRGVEVHLARAHKEGSS